MSFDLYIFQAFNGLVGKNWLFDSFSFFFSEYSLFLLIILAIYFGWTIKNWRNKISFFLLSLTSLIVSRGIIVEILKLIFKRERPSDFLNIETIIHGSGFSFPSGHTAFLFTLAFSIWVLNKKWGSIFIVLSFLTAISRIITGAHWPTDIIFGILIGSIIPFILEPYFFKNKKEKSPPLF